MRASLWLSLILVVQCVSFSNSAGLTTSTRQLKNLVDYSGRALLQSGVTCSAQIPACTARRCTTRILDSKETYVCLRCLRSYVPARGSDGKSIVQCVCPPGTYQVVNGGRSCQPCPAGSYCPGGNKNARKPTDNYGGASNSCNPPNSSGLTTKSTRATKATDCVALGGYALPRTREGPASECPPSTYSPNLNSLKSCLPCQSGLQEAPDFKSNGGIRNSREAVCRLPPGRFWELNVVRDCPVGLYREGFINTTDPAAINCLSCPEGWSTQATQSTARSNCSRLLPGVKLVSYQPGSDAILSQDLSTLAGEATEPCPLGYYFDGNSPGVYGCLRCRLGSTTKQTGSTSVNDCLVPPGYYIQSPDSGVTGQMVKCPNNISAQADAPASGYFRSGWVSPTQVLDTDGATACTPCGFGIPSLPIEPEERVDLVPPADPAADPTYGLVAATAAACYIEAGWGMTFDPLDFQKFRAIILCPANTYGVSKRVFGLFMAPCKACTKNLYSLPGSTSMEDCKNPGGFGYTSEGANQCPDGFWAAQDSMNPCEPCPEGRMTSYVPGDGSYQSSLESCKVKPGMGVYSGASASPWAPEDKTAAMQARPCPFDMYSSGDADDVNATSNPTCQACLDNQATSSEGSSTCDVCKPGAGGAPGQCSICPYNTYQPGWETSDGLTCKSCPRNSWNHDIGETVQSYGITFFTGMTNAYMCVPRYSQAANPAGARLALPDTAFSVVPDIATVTDCITACPVDQCCIAEFEYEEGGATVCKHALLPPAKPVAFVASVGSDGIARLYYKLPPSGMFAAASIKGGNNSSTGVNTSAVDGNSPQLPTGMLAAASVSTGSNSSSNSSNSSNSSSTLLDGKVKAKTLASGVFAVCDMTAWQEDAAAGLVGTSPNPALVEAGRDAIEWDVWGSCSDEASCHQSCISDASCWGFIYVPGKGFALRTGEAGLGVRSFFVSPDPAAAQAKSDGGVSAANAAAYSLLN